MKEKPAIAAALLMLGAVSLAAHAPGAQPAPTQTDVAATIEQFDEVRALAMRALIRAQELKTAYVYGRGFTLKMPEYICEDLVMEGLWLFDYLYSMDITAMSLISYAAAARHPHLAHELELFRAYLSEAARKTIAYYDKASQALADAVERVNAAGARKSAFRLETIPSRPWSDDPSVRASAGDGFNLGWAWPLIQGKSSTLGRHLTQHGYSQERFLRLAAGAGISFVCPEDRNLFDWIDVEKEEGTCDWSRIDKLLALCKKYDMALWLPLPSYNTGPPQWLRERLGDEAVLTGPGGQPLSVKTKGWDNNVGINDIREQNNPINLFNPHVSKAFARYVQRLITHVRESGVRIVAVELGNRSVLPFYSGPDACARWRAWLEKNKIDPREHWNMDIDLSETVLPDKVETAGVADPGRRQMLLDTVRWREDECVEYFRVQVDAIRAVAPELPICTQSCDRGGYNESMNGRPNERLVRELGLASFGSANGANIWDDLRRSYSPAGWSATAASVGSGDSPSQYSFSSYVHGTLTIVTGPVPMVRGFSSQYCYHYPDVRWQWAALYNWRRFHERAQGMAPEMLNTRPDVRVAVLWSDTTNKYQSFTSARGSAANHHKAGCLGWSNLLSAICLTSDIVTEYQVRQGRLQDYQMLVMPAVQALPADVAERIRQFVANGGLVVATSAPALFGDDLKQKGGGQLADVFGADFDRFLGESVIAPMPTGIPVASETASWQIRNRTRVEAHNDSLRTLYCTFKPREGAKVFERFTTGDPAAVLNSVDRGKAVVIGYPLGRESFLSDPGSHRAGRVSSWSPNGSSFTRAMMRWFELLFPRLGLERAAVPAYERVPRGWSDWKWTRRNADCRDYGWHLAADPRSVELMFRRREGNPNAYLVVFNREGGGGNDDPGLIHFESTSKYVQLKMGRGDITHIYDLSLGCPVPFTQVRARPGIGGGQTTFGTIVEPSMARMLVLATGGAAIRMYAGNRRHGRDDDVIRQAASKLVTGAPPPDKVLFGPEDILNFLAERASRGISISAESPLYVPAAKRLAAAIEREYGKKARITRGSPRMAGPHDVFIERPDILMGSHNESHHIAVHMVFYQRGGDHLTAPLPIMPSHTFPGPGRSVVTLMRPFAKRYARQDEGEGKVYGEERAAPQLVVAASDARGLEAGVDSLIELIEP